MKSTLFDSAYKVEYIKALGCIAGRFDQMFFLFRVYIGFSIFE